MEEVEKDVFIPFIHRPMSRYVNAMAESGLILRRMLEPAPPPGFLARAAEYLEAASIPRLLVLVARRTEPSSVRAFGAAGYARVVTDFVVITGLSGAGRSHGGRRARGPGLVRHRQHAGGR